MIPNMPYQVPLFYQISDITSVEWQQKGCGVADVAMIVEFYKPNTTTVENVLKEGIAVDAYQKGVGWKHAGLASLADKHGLVGQTFDFGELTKVDAYSEFKNILDEGPAIASIHRNFDPKNSFGHLVVMTGYDDALVYFNDPGKKEGLRTIPIAEFMRGWKRVLIVMRPPLAQLETEITLGS